MSTMYMLACGDKWIKEDTEIEKLKELRNKLEKKKEYKNKILSLFNLKDYTDMRMRGIKYENKNK